MLSKGSPLFAPWVVGLVFDIPFRLPPGDMSSLVSIACRQISGEALLVDGVLTLEIEAANPGALFRLVRADFLKVRDGRWEVRLPADLGAYANSPALKSWASDRAYFLSLPFTAIGEG